MHVYVYGVVNEILLVYVDFSNKSLTVNNYSAVIHFCLISVL